MNNFDDLIRSFGMSGLLVSEELRGLEKQLGIDLGHQPPKTPENVTDYYPQFEERVRREASSMARHYELFYCLENAIRSLIAETLQESAGSDWWASGKIPDAVKKGVADRIKRDIDSGMTRRSDASIDYTNFGELSVIIISNWDLFGTIFSSQRAVERVMSNLNLLRGPIAHCCPITEDEVTRLELSVRDWFRMIG
jgi:hypothetical protein